MEKKKKKRYVTPVAVVKDKSPVDSLLIVSGPKIDPDAEADDEYGFDARGNNLGFSDWFDDTWDL